VCLYIDMWVCDMCVVVCVAVLVAVCVVGCVAVRVAFYVAACVAVYV